jgi:hypothetical protein
VEDEDDDPNTPTEPILVTIAGLEMLRENQSICVCVTEKSSLRTGVKGPGCVFSIDVEDASDKSIWATFFNEEAETYYDMMNQGNMYTFDNTNLHLQLGGARGMVPTLVLYGGVSCTECYGSELFAQPSDSTLQYLPSRQCLCYNLYKFFH